MRLQGVIEAPVNGGSSVYINAFLKRQLNEQDPCIDVEASHKLHDLMKQQFSILETGLAMHQKLAPPELMPLHSLLEKRLKDAMRPLLEVAIPALSFNGSEVS